MAMLSFCGVDVSKVGKMQVTTAALLIADVVRS